MNFVICVYISLLPSILAAIINMLWCKSNFFKNINKPIDNYKNFKDGKRIFGNNKTYKGFLGYIVLNILIFIIYGSIIKHTNLIKYDLFYRNHDSTIVYNIIIGFLLGFSYAFLELPNSFLKRRLNIESGKLGKGINRYIFFIYDQVDSIVGILFILWLVYHFSLLKFLICVCIGLVTHFIINIILYVFKIRKNII